MQYPFVRIKQDGIKSGIKQDQQSTEEGVLSVGDGDRDYLLPRAAATGKEIASLGEVMSGPEFLAL